MSISHKTFNIFILLLHYNVSTALCHTCRKLYSICLKSLYAINRIHLFFLYLHVDTCYYYTKIYEVMQEPHSRLLKLQIISGIFCYLVIANNFFTYFLDPLIALVRKSLLKNMNWNILIAWPHFKDNSSGISPAI